MSTRRKAATAAARAGVGSDTAFGAVMPPIHLAANFTFEAFGKKRRYDYTRSGNPTRDLLGDALAELEGASRCVVTASGLAAITLVLARLRPDQLVLAPHDGYGGTWRLLKALSGRGHFRVALVDQTDPRALAQALAQRPALVWVETPSNPLLRITDVRAVSDAAHAVGALVAVDNTFLTPVLQEPLQLGADLVVHSTTKYLNGHSDVVGGAVLAKDAGLGEDLHWWANALGLTGAPFDSWLTLRGLRTLPARMRLHESNARAVAAFLAGHPAVAAVHWPGRPEHPGHALAREQQRGFGGIVSFELEGGLSAVERLVGRLRCFSLAESLGGVESLIAHPATMTHASMDAAAREVAGIGDALLRLSVGIEAEEDLLEDLRQALE
jgi:cystathionine gamma-synthase